MLVCRFVARDVKRHDICVINAWKQWNKRKYLVGLSRMIVKDITFEWKIDVTGLILKF
jgi:hypothetical protein